MSGSELPPVRSRTRIELTDEPQEKAAGKRITISSDQLGDMSADFVPGYRIVRPIGRGGMGVVYLAVQERLDRQVALKVLAPELAGDASFRRRFREEAELAAAVRSPFVVPVLDAGEAGGRLFVATAYIAGEDLRRVLGRGPLAPKRAVRTLTQAAAALDAVHSAGLVHRDVKPGNIVLDEEGNAHLCDFGLARHVASTRRHTVAGQWIGTPDYVSPEQVQGRPVDRRADVYSLGCVFFEMLTGAAPFARESDIATATAQVSEPVPSVTSRQRGLSPGWDRAIAGALAKDPAGRFPTAGALARSAQDVLAGRSLAKAPPAASSNTALRVAEPTRAAGVPPPPPPPPGQHSGDGHRRRAGFIAAVVAAVALLCGGTVAALLVTGVVGGHHAQPSARKQTGAVARDTDRLGHEVAGLPAGLTSSDPAVRSRSKRELGADRDAAEKLLTRAHRAHHAATSARDRHLTNALIATNKRLVELLGELASLRSADAAARAHWKTKLVVLQTKIRRVQKQADAPSSDEAPTKPQTPQQPGAGDPATTPGVITEAGPEWHTGSGAAPPAEGAQLGYDPSSEQLVLVRPCDDPAGACDPTTGGTWIWRDTHWYRVHQAAPACPNGAPTTIGTMPDADDLNLELLGSCDDDPALQSWTWDGSAWSDPAPEVDESGAETTAPSSAALASDGSGGALLLGRAPDDGQTMVTLKLDGSWGTDDGWTEPTARTDGALGYDQSAGTYVLFGGTATDGQVLRDTWVWRHGGWRPLPRAGGPAGGSYTMIGGDAEEVLTLVGTDEDGRWQTWTWSGDRWHARRGSGAGAPFDVGPMLYAQDPNASVLVATGGDDTLGTWYASWDG